MDLQAFTREIAQDIPLSQHMGFNFTNFSPGDDGGRCLRTELPLGPNLNDKHTAFGGSIATLATLSGWSLVTLICRELGRPAQVVVYRSSQEYTAPIQADFYSLARLDQAAWQEFRQQLLTQGRAKAKINVEIFAEGSNTPAATYEGYYLATYAN
ncbi:MAG: thioesterase domain-containing protein [Cellvibrionaceae bacterium]|nr:thioesterase domain-containing protein [Cellvibrionaceae bacterium]MCV6624563.1 thioesterase domain-containing protein [Cellvibrionaceae bacterium]